MKFAELPGKLYKDPGEKFSLFVESLIFSRVLRRAKLGSFHKKEEQHNEIKKAEEETWIRGPIVMLFLLFIRHSKRPCSMN